MLPSLWEAVAGVPDADWAIRDETGKPVGFNPEFGRLWRWKDELPEQRLAIAGRHLGRFAMLAAPALAPALVATRAEGDWTPLEQELAEAVREHGPASAPELRLLLGTADRKAVERAVGALHRRLVLTNAGLAEQESGWPAIRHDLFERRWRARLRRRPLDPAEARRRLVACVLLAAGEVSAADVRAALGWRLREAAAVLDELGDAGLAVARDEGGYRLWRPVSPGGRRGRRAAR